MAPSARLSRSSGPSAAKLKGRVFRGILVRRGGKFYAYQNLCQHLPITLDLNDEAHHISKTVAREHKRSLGSFVSEFIIGKNQSPDAEVGTLSRDSGFPTFRCIRRVTSGDVEALKDEGLNAFRVPVVSLIVIVVVAALAGVVAAILPAWRASRLPPAEAVRYTE